MGKVLLYSVPQEIHRKISDMCLTLNFEVKKIPKRRFLQPIGCHAGALGYDNGITEQSDKDLDEPMLVFYEINDKQLDVFLAKYKANNIEPISCKAIITKHNIDWNAYELYKELTREREALKSIANIEKK